MTVVQHLLEKYVRKSFNPDAEGLAGLQWDSAELFKVNKKTLQMPNFNFPNAAFY